jgi:hypothetical protein
VPDCEVRVAVAGGTLRIVEAAIGGAPTGGDEREES